MNCNIIINGAKTPILRGIVKDSILQGKRRLMFTKRSNEILGSVNWDLIGIQKALIVVTNLKIQYNF